MYIPLTTTYILKKLIPETLVIIKRLSKNKVLIKAFINIGIKKDDLKVEGCISTQDGLNFKFS